MTSPVERLMLVDGMGLLVRCSRAAGRQAPMTYEGHVTGPLTLFMGSLTARLAQHGPTHAVVAWEGVPEANWRRRLYAQYKPRALAAARQQMSEDEELARGFCAAAGLRQDWSAEFEGDDIIASWWRTARAWEPSAEVAIISDDRDLLQLCDGLTTVWPLSSEDAEYPATGASVELAWGCRPERLPLLRALAGDQSDGIPGIPGLGPVRAAELVRNQPNGEGLLQALAKARGKDDGSAGLARLYWSLMDLREPIRHPAFPPDGIEALETAQWKPEEQSAAMLEFLRGHGMQRMTKRLMAGKLPWPPQD